MQFVFHGSFAWLTDLFCLFLLLTLKVYEYKSIAHYYLYRFAEQFYVESVVGGINIYGSSSKNNWYLTVGEKSDGGVDTYPTFQPVVRLVLHESITILESYKGNT